MQQSQQQINSAGVKVNEVHPQPLTSIGKFWKTVIFAFAPRFLGIFHPRTTTRKLAISIGRILYNYRCIATYKVQGYSSSELEINPFRDGTELKIIFAVVVVVYFVVGFVALPYGNQPLASCFGFRCVAERRKQVILLTSKVFCWSNN